MDMTLKRIKASLGLPPLEEKPVRAGVSSATWYKMAKKENLQLMALLELIYCIP